ncbi:MAG: hypothetical protein R3Y43_08500 [Alphaproteobacteria bacterium]
MIKKLKKISLSLIITTIMLFSSDVSAQTEIITSSSEISFNQTLNFADEACNPESFYGWFDNCLFCHLFKTVYNAASSVAAKAYKTFAGPVAEVLFVATAIWLALKILPFMSSLKGASAPELLMEILKQMLLVFIIITFLKSDDMGFFTYIMEPIFNTGFSIAKALLDTGTSCSNDYGILTGENAGLPASMGNSVVCVIEQIQASIASVLAMGVSALCIALFVEYLFIPVVIPDFAFLITGIFLMLGGVMLLIVFPFIVLDSVLQLAVAAGLLPFALGCYPFKKTKEYATKIWDTFMSAIFNFVFLCLIMMICVKTINGTVADQVLDSIKSGLLENNIGYFLELFGWESVLFLKVLFLFILAKVMLEEVENFAGQFAGSGMQLGMGKKIGGVVASGALNMAKKTLINPLAKKAKSALKSGIKKGISGFQRMRTQQIANYNRKQFEKLSKTQPQNNGPLTSPKLENLNNRKEQLEKQKEELIKRNASPKEMRENARKLKTVNQAINQERKRLKKENPNHGMPNQVKKERTLFGIKSICGFDISKRLGHKTITKNDDGTFTVEIQKRNRKVTKEIGRDAEGHSTVTIAREKTKEQRSLRRAKEKGTSTTNKDGSVTYTYSDTLGRQMHVTQHADGRVTKAHVTIDGRIVKKDISYSKTVETRTHQGISSEVLSADGNVLHRQDQAFTGDVGPIVNSDGKINRFAISRMKEREQKLLNQLNQLKKEPKNKDKNEEQKRQQKILDLRIQIKTERDENTRLIAATVAEKSIDKSVFNPKDKDFATEETQSSSKDNHDTFKVTRTKDDGTKQECTVVVTPKGNTVVSYTQENKDKSSVTLKTDGVLQKKTVTSTDQTQKSKFSVNEKEATRLNNIKDPKVLDAELQKLVQQSSFTLKEKEEAIKNIKDQIAKQKEIKPIQGLK